MSHTPGPWTWIRNGCTLIGAGLGDGCQVLSIDLPEFITDEDKCLIAAAPDLLNACVEWLEFAEGLWTEAELDMQFGGNVAAIRDAIAKAKP